MAKIEQGEGLLVSVDTSKKTLRIQELPDTIPVFVEGRSPEQPKEREYPYSLEWEDRQFFDLVGKHVEYILSDGTVVNLLQSKG